ncbi:BadF/BadG/BcrA/BcrD ATPase family protein [Dinoroseobacter sp. S76]|uniref:BadF/BadG/BcrA/BcrD ATPase family protein n=1 Tax=Dinoroseobacter sp. S76 TaxID=3415124 RepID=UPI003C7E5D6F
MTQPNETNVLAIDGGGTRCRIALGAGDDITMVESGSANVSTDFDGGVAQIETGLQALAAQLGTTTDSLSPLPTFVGLAGVTGPEIANRLEEALPFATLHVSDDRPAALRGALGSADGVIAHCGTGSFYGAQRDRRMRFSGGWGPVLGDEASAQWIGRAALARTLETVDGRRPSSRLAEILLAEHGGAAGIVRFAGAAHPAEFGQLAPRVTAQAREGDSLARDIMTAGAAEIARSLPQIGWKAGQTICLTGGIGPEFAPYLPEALRAALAAPTGTPLDGALSLARDLARGVTP